MYGEGPGKCFEGMTTLAALATATSRIRLGLLVTGVTYRHPSVLAAQAVTVDHASHGRFGAGAGRRLVRGRAPPARDRVSGRRASVSTAWRTRSRSSLASHRRGRLLRRRTISPRRGPPAAPPRPAPSPADLDRRLRTTAYPSRWRPATPTSGTPSAVPRSWPNCRLASTGWLRRPVGILPRLSGRRRSRCRSPRPKSASNIERLADAGFGYLVCGWPGEGREPRGGISPAR